MPFASQAQARFLFAKAPSVAKEFAAATPSIKALPQHLASAKAAVSSFKSLGQPTARSSGAKGGVRVHAPGFKKLSSGVRAAAANFKMSHLKPTKKI